MHNYPNAQLPLYTQPLEISSYVYSIAGLAGAVYMTWDMLASQTRMMQRIGQ